MLFIDLDQFKQVNSSAGHECGDQLLEAAGQRLRACVREEDIVARFGGDEFVVVLPRINNGLDARIVADKLIAALSENHCLTGGEFQLSASIGISIFPDDAQCAEDLLRQADFAMFRAKAAGRGQYAFFDEAVSRKAIDCTNLELDLRRAAKDQEFVVMYQLQVNLRTGAIEGAEALVRWNHPQRGMVPPGEFIEIAEQSNVILQIDDFVLRTACKQFRAWELAGIAPQRISVNVTVKELNQPDFADRVEAILLESQLRPFYLELEITEGSLLVNSQQLQAQLDRLRSRGIRIALDDFGTGYSSLNYLKRLPVDVVKIDQSFVRDIGKDEDSTAIVRAMIDMAHSLGKVTVAEGVETMEQYTLLAALGCEVGQGYLWSRRIPAVEFERLCCGWDAARQRRLPSKLLAA